MILNQSLLNDAGKMAKKLWKELSKYYAGVEIDYFQIMPDHLHGIIHLVEVIPFLIAIAKKDNHRGLSLPCRYPM